MRKLALLLLLTLPAGASQPAVTSAPADAIAAGKPYWVDSQPDPEFSSINAQVDIGNLRQVGDALETELRWPPSPGQAWALRETYPEAEIPDDSVSLYTERVVCGQSGHVSFAVSMTVLAPDGKPIFYKAFDPQQARIKGEAMAYQPPEGFYNSGYGSDPRSLLCWAAARKCQGQSFSWPPPGNLAPLDNSETARKLNAAYSKRFVPSCKL